MTIDQAMDIKNTQIVEELNLPPVKIHCSVLAEDAIKGAIADYKAKRAAKTGKTGEKVATAKLSEETAAS
jgi:nitrogen fixation NifU-like protein